MIGQLTMTSATKDFDCFQTSQLQTCTNSKHLECESPPRLGESSLPQLANSTSDSDGQGSQNCLIDTANSSTSPDDQLHHLTDESSQPVKSDTGLNSPITSYGSNLDLNTHSLGSSNQYHDINYFSRCYNFTNTTNVQNLTDTGSLFSLNTTHGSDYFNMGSNSPTSNAHVSIDSNSIVSTNTNSTVIPSSSNTTSASPHMSTAYSTRSNFDSFTNYMKPNSMIPNYRSVPENEHPFPSYLTSFSFVDSLNSKHMLPDSTHLDPNVAPDRLQSSNPACKLSVGLSDSQRNLNFDQYANMGLGHRSGSNCSQPNPQLISLDNAFPLVNTGSHMSRLSSSSPVQPMLPYMKQLGNDSSDGAMALKHLTWAPSPNTFNYRGHTGHPPEFSSARRRNATKESTATLKAWLQEHIKNPYPTKGEKIMLAIITKMTLTQVSTWFANARRRLKKENKMTWTPKHRGEEQAEDDDEDEDEGDMSQSDEEANLADDSINQESGHLSSDKDVHNRKHFVNYECKLDSFSSEMGDMKSDLFRQRLRMPLKQESRMGRSDCHTEQDFGELGPYRESICSPGLDCKNLTNLHQRANPFDSECDSERLDKFEMGMDRSQHMNHTNIHENSSTLTYIPKKSWDIESFGNFNRTLQSHFLQDSDHDWLRMHRNFRDEFVENQRKLTGLQEQKNSCSNQPDWPNTNQSEPNSNLTLKPDHMAFQLRSSYLNNYNLNLPPYKQDTLPFHLAQPLDLNRPLNPYEACLPNSNPAVQPECSTPHAFYNQLCSLSNPVNLLSGTCRPISNLLISSTELSSPDNTKFPNPFSPTHDSSSDHSYNATSANTTTTASVNIVTTTTSSDITTSSNDTTVSRILTPHDSHPNFMKSGPPNRLSSWFFPVQTRPEDLTSDLAHSEHTSPFQSSSNSSSNPTVGFSTSPKCLLGQEQNADELNHWPNTTVTTNPTKAGDSLVKSIYGQTDSEDNTLNPFYLPNYGTDYANGTHDTQLRLSS